MDMTYMIETMVIIILIVNAVLGLAAGAKHKEGESYMRNPAYILQGITIVLAVIALIVMYI